MPKVSVVVPAYNAEETIARCLEALVVQEGIEEALEIVVVDDGSTDRTAEVVERFESVTLLRQENAGPGEARNTGARFATGDYILFTDSDCIPGTHWAAEMLKGFVEHGAGLVIGQTTTHYGSENLLAKTLRGSDLVANTPGPITRFNSNNLGLRRDIALNLPFDISLRIYGEDSDLGWRVLAAGHRTYYCPEAKLDHQHAHTYRSFIRSGYLHGKGAARLYYKHGLWFPRDLLPLLLSLLALVISGVWSAQRSLWVTLSLGLFGLFIAALIFNETHYKQKSWMMALLTLPIQFCWYLAKTVGYLHMIVRLLLGLEPEVRVSKRALPR